MKNLVVISGGSINEYKISLKSGYDISESIYKEKINNFFNIIITPDKKWIYGTNLNNTFIFPLDINKININRSLNEIYQIGNGMINNIKIDMAILTTHGINGEDGKLQGLLDMYNIPYIGSDTLGSAICMDKEVAKILVKSIGIKVLPWTTFFSNTWESKINIDDILNNYGDKLVVKTTNSGSSNGVFLSNISKLKETLKKTFLIHNKIIIESEKNIREIEISFIGDEFSHIGEIIKKKNFYDYKQKYLEEIELIVPAKIDFVLKEQIIKESIKIKEILNIKNFARIDYFLIDNELYFNEVNTLPGFQKTSMFPKLWYFKGLYFIDIINKIIEDALTINN